MKVNVAVCGKFHYHNYIKYLENSGVLNRFYYSHKISTNYNILGVSGKRCINLWYKEYLMYAQQKIMPQFSPAVLATLHADAWQLGVLLNWQQCDIYHLMLHGTGIKTINKNRSQGGISLLEPVNAHPDIMHEIIKTEADRLGIHYPSRPYRIQMRQSVEADNADFLLAPSRWVRDSFVQHGFPESRIFILPYGVNCDRFKFDTFKNYEIKNKFGVICVAQISLRKGQKYLLDAWQILNLKNADLLLIGAMHGNMRKILKPFAGKYTHIPAVPNPELYKYYNQASVFVLPTLEDGFAVVVGEAMACGLPVITTDHAGAADIIEDGKDGFIVPIRNPQAIAEKIELLYRNPELREEMSRNALKKAQTQLSWETYAGKLCKIYEEIYSRRQQG